MALVQNPKPWPPLYPRRIGACLILDEQQGFDDNGSSLFGGASFCCAGGDFVGRVSSPGSCAGE
jgi:hypothetical protein